MWKDQNSSSHVQAKSALGFPPWSSVPALWPPVLPPWYKQSPSDLHPKFSFFFSFVPPTSYSKKTTYICDFPHHYIFVYLCCKAPFYFSSSNEMAEALSLTKNKYLLWILNKSCKRLGIIPFSNNQSECWRCYLLPNLVIRVFERNNPILRLFLKPWIRSFPKAWLMSRYENHSIFIRPVS